MERIYSVPKLFLKIATYQGVKTCSLIPRSPYNQLKFFKHVNGFVFACIGRTDARSSFRVFLRPDRVARVWWSSRRWAQLSWKFGILRLSRQLLDISVLGSRRLRTCPWRWCTSLVSPSFRTSGLWSASENKGQQPWTTWLIQSDRIRRKKYLDGHTVSDVGAWER